MKDVITIYGSGCAKCAALAETTREALAEIGSEAEVVKETDFAKIAAATARERCVCELQEIAGRDISTVSSHLNLLKNAGILVCEQRGRQVFYSLACPCLAEVFACVLAGGKCA